LSSSGKSSGNGRDLILEHLVKMAVERGAEDTSQLRSFLALKAEFMAKNLKEVDERGGLFYLSQPEQIGKWKERPEFVTGVDFSEEPDQTASAVVGQDGKVIAILKNLKPVEVRVDRRTIREAPIGAVAEIDEPAPGMFVSGRHSGGPFDAQVRWGPQGGGREVRGALPEDQEDAAEGDGGVDHQQSSSSEEGEG
jgi:hypothetical protein